MNLPALLLCAALGAAGPAPPDRVAGLPVAQALELGQRMYRDGILPSGDPMQAVVSGDVPVSGTAFTCANCHLRAGLGSFEGGIVTLPTNGAKLAQPLYWKLPNLAPEERKKLGLAMEPVRPAYTDRTLADALTSGIDPAGRVLNPVMPRYTLAPRDQEILIAYLKTLSSAPSPGVDATTLRLATVITEEVRPEDRDAMLVPLDNYIARHNSHAGGFDTRMYLNAGGVEMSGGYRLLSLSRWLLKGPPGTWRMQLEDFYRKEPVFALLGGISTGDWTPIHEFCEANRLPCLFPLTDFPSLGAGDWYTLYFNKGHHQEGQAAARYLAGRPGGLAAKKVLQVVGPTPAGRALAAGFREAWLEAGHAPVASIELGAGEAADGALLAKLLVDERPAAVLLWLGDGEARALQALQGLRDPPEFLCLSSTLLNRRMAEIPEAARPYTFLTYPFRDPLEEPKFSRYAAPLMAGLTAVHPETRISTRTFALLQVFTKALMEMDRNFYRDHFLDRIGMLPDMVLPDFVRLSFGPGQRYASKGCYLAQLGPGPSPKLLLKSDWVIH